MAADKGKKVKVSAEDKEEFSAAEQEIINSIGKLQDVQGELDKINEEASEKVLEVEQRYNKLRAPVYEKRSEIIKSIPDFWLKSFLSHPALATLLTQEDHKIFRFFSTLEVKESKDVKLGFSITFNFRPNPYFEDTKLTKTFTCSDEGITNITATEIKWKEGMGISNGDTQKKGKKRSLEEGSFFTWFGSSMHEEEVQDDVAEIIKNDVWPQPLTFFNGNSDDEEDGDEDNDEVERVRDGSNEDDDDNDDEEGNEEGGDDI